MTERNLDEILVIPMRRIPVEGGDVLHALKRTDPGFSDFGEAYFSMIYAGVIKAWKLHRRMTLNLVVPVGEVHFVFYIKEGNLKRELTIGESNYSRLTVPPGIWFGFHGIAHPFSLILNIADIPHDPNEVERMDIDSFNYKWK